MPAENTPDIDCQQIFFMHLVEEYTIPVSLSWINDNIAKKPSGVRSSLTAVHVDYRPSPQFGKYVEKERSNVYEK